MTEPIVCPEDGVEIGIDLDDKIEIIEIDKSRTDYLEDYGYRYEDFDLSGNKMGGSFFEVEF